MPCYDPRSDEEADKVRDQRNHFQVENGELQEKADRLTAMLCAVLGCTAEDLNDEDDFDTFLDDASKRCNINIKDWYEEHRKTDKTRVLKQLRRDYSLEEIKLLKKLFKNDDV